MTERPPARESSAQGEFAQPLGRALLARLGGGPAALERYVTVMAREGPTPAFVEHSIHTGPKLEAARLTHYFEATRRDAARAVGERFAEVLAALDLELPGALASIVTSPETDRLVQIVLGIDGRESTAQTRAKYYAQLGREDADFVTGTASALGFALPARLDPTEVFMLGLDVTRGGVADVKAYLRLDRGRLARIFRNLSEVAPLVEFAEAVVLSQSLGSPGRRQLHFHAGRRDRYRTFVDERLAGVGDHLRALTAELPGMGFEVTIVGLPYRDGHVSLEGANVYVHPSLVLPPGEKAR